MAGRRPGIKTFTQTQRARELAADMEDNQGTVRKTIWSPPPSMQSLMTKVDHMEQRLEHLETLIAGHQTDPKTRQQEQEEVDQSRQELEDMRRQLDEAVGRLQQREAELHDTRNALDNLNNQTAIDRQKIQTLEEEKKQLDQLVHELEIKLNERVRKIGRLEKQVSDMQRSLNNTNNQLAFLQQQMEQMQRQMNVMVASGVNATPPQQPPGMARSSSPGPQPKLAAVSPRHHTGTLGLPPIAIPPTSQSQNGKRSRDSAMNFPPTQK